MNDKDKLIEQLIREKGGTRQEYLSLLDKIAYHESAHTFDPELKQYGGGPGRGKYQFEEGKNQGGITAARRTKRYLESTGQEVPKWLNSATSLDSLDATELTAEQQDILFLGNMRMHPKADLGKVVNGEESVEDFWANYHWAGDAEDRKERINSFRDSVDSYAKVAPRDVIKKKIDRPLSNERYATTKDNINQIEQLPVEPELMQPTQIAQPQQLIKPEVNQPQPQQQADSKPSIAQLDTKAYTDLYGYLKTNQANKELAQYNTGGTHQENPMGGIPIGMGPNGQMNTVEEGETSYNFGDDKFVFSDRIAVNDKKNGNNFSTTSMTNTFALGGMVDPPTKKDPRALTIKSRDTTNPNQFIAPKEGLANDYYKQLTEEKELKATGNIVNPSSQRYKRPSSNITNVRQDTRSESTYNTNVKASTDIKDATLNTLERPLVYMANPLKAAGDLVSNFNPNNNPFPTSEEDARKIAYNDSFGNRSKIGMGLDYIPEAALNVAGMEGLALSRNSIGSKAMKKLLTKSEKSYANDEMKAVSTDIYNNDSLIGKGLSKLEEMYNKHIYPKVYKKPIDKLLNHKQSQIDLFKTEEGKKRLGNLGVRNEKYNKFMNNLENSDLLTSPSMGSLHDSRQNMININFKQAKNLKEKLNLSPEQIYDHELGHFMQNEINTGVAYPYKKERLDLWDFATSDIDYTRGRGYSTSNVAPTFIDNTLLSLDLKGSQELAKMSAKEKKFFTDNKDYFTHARNSYGTDVDNSVERMPFLREYRQAMVEKNMIKNKYDDVTPEMVGEFFKKSPKTRLNKIMKDTDSNRKLISELLKYTPAAAIPAVLKNTKKK